ncbi:hypothetical protein Nepgr_003987 [Nepenthes gracilis]|uniref:Uncharacterized protein n=1 Tax=Nepenthes gracilis TaxID=150966 RepID=A0AAD3S0M1_NEPGR|nr:hypothetical protein Nepgr_003987 [Nepenthes gracilis]
MESKETLPSPTLIEEASSRSSLDASKEKEVKSCDGLVERSSYGNLMIPHPPLCEVILAVEEPCHYPCAGDVLVPSSGEVPMQVPIACEDALLDSGIEHNLIDTGHDPGIVSVQTPNCPPRHMLIKIPLPLLAPVENLSLVDEPRKHPCCGRQMDPALMGCKSRVFSSILHHSGWGYNSCTGGAVDEADADADVASVWCWLYAADAARSNVMQNGLLNFGFCCGMMMMLLQEIMILVVLRVLS